MMISGNFKVVGGLLTLALVVGGAGVSFPRLQMLLQVCALAAAAYLVVTRRSWRIPRLSRLALVLLVAILVLPLLQLVPLPPSVWTALPGRSLFAQADVLMGVTLWRPLTLDVEGTLRSFVVLLPPAAIFAGCLFLTTFERAQLLWVVVAVAAVSAVLGIVQLATGGWLTPYPSGHSGYPVGLFVNRNHHAALLLVAMPVAAALGAMQISRGKPRASWVVASLSAVAIYAMVIVGTSSRMGFILLPFSLMASLLLLFYRQAASHLVAASLIGLAALATVLLATGRLDRTLARFSGIEDARFAYWTDIWWALDYYGLAGTGFGTFVPVYKSAESLAAVVPQVINHAHNDYLEILLEGGWAAALLFLLFLLIIAFAAFRSIATKSRPGQASATGAALAGIVILLAASVVDYPLRMPALSAIFALFCALLLSSPAQAVSTTTTVAVSPGPARHGLVVAKFTILAALLVLVVQAGISADRLSARDNEVAQKAAGWSTNAHERLATAALVRNDLPGATFHARSAIALSPISAPAIRSLGLARLAQGATKEGYSLMQIAVGLGWRDPLSQLWAIEAAKASREPEKALQRAEALFRQDALVAPAIAQLLDAPDTQTLPLLADMLARRPAWRKPFFKASAVLPPQTAGEWAKLVELLKQTDAPASLEEGQFSLGTLIKAGQIDEAQRLWRLLQRGNERVSNGDFEEVDRRRGTAFPAFWDVPRRNRSLVRVETTTSSGRALHIRSTEEATVIRQTLLLEPGTYTLSYRARALGPFPATFQWVLRCGASGARQSSEAELRPSQEWQTISTNFTVPIQNCSIQRLALMRSGAKPIEGVLLDEIQLRPASS